MTPSCVKCGGLSFDFERVPIGNAGNVYQAICCTKCGGVVDIHELKNLTFLIIQQNVAIKKIAEKVGVEVDLVTIQPR